MTDYAFYTDNQSFGPLDGSTMARFGGHSDGWVAPDTMTLVVDDLSGFDAGPYNAFEYLGANGLDVTIDTGEALIYGSPIARDTQTTYTLAASTANQVLFVGYEPLSQNRVVIGRDGDFTANARKIPIHEFTTQSNSVSNHQNRREVGVSIDVQNTRYEDDDGTVKVANADLLDGIDSNQFARTDVPETFTDTVTIEDPDGEYALRVVGANELDSKVMEVIGDADQGQDEDTFAVYGLGNPEQSTPQDSDTVVVVKGYGKVGINTHNPEDELEVNGSIGGKAAHINQMGDGLYIGISDTNRLFMAPVADNNPVFSSEITYYDTLQRWVVESNEFTAPSVSRVVNNQDVMTGQSLSRRADVTIPNATLEDGEGWDAMVAGNNETARVLRVSVSDEGGTHAPSGCRVEISGEGGGQRQDFVDHLSEGSLSNPLHTVNISTGACRVRLYNNSGSEQILNAHVVMQLV